VSKILIYFTTIRLEIRGQFVMMSISLSNHTQSV